jgi:predicted enzyme related to lactoylglutathione lyase
MSTRTQPWPAGTPNWVDLTTSDREAAWDFYRDVMGWTITDSGPDYGHYGMADVDGRPAAGLMETQPGDPAPPRWTTYFAADSVDASAAAVTAHGGKVIVGPMDVPGQGRMAVAIDPTGATFGLWQAGGHIGYQHVNEPGGVVWNQLASPDLAAAKDFYAAVFGYTYTDMGEMATINGDGPGGTVGGLGSLEAGNPEAQPQWSVIFSVADADATTTRAEQLGATVLFGPVDSEWGRMATLRDPQGAEFGIIGASAP